MAFTIARTLKDIVSPLAIGAVVLLTQNIAAAIKWVILYNKLEKVANIKNSGDPFKAFATLQAFLATILNPLYNATSAILSTLFDGSAVSTYRLQTIISDGLILSTQNPSATDSVANIKAMMYGFLIPVAWATSNQNLCPFVLDYGQDYGAGCPEHTYFDNWASVKTCYNGRTYFLLNANGWSYDGSSVLGLLPGTGDLIAGSYGITLDNIIHG